MIQSASALGLDISHVHYGAFGRSVITLIIGSDTGSIKEYDKPNDIAKPARFPLLETLLAYGGLPMKGKFSTEEVADLFGVTTRTIQTRIKRGSLASRDLPGRSKFLAIDLEQFLQGSPKQAS